jgi:asparagine synthase (glutamine-hydrolysing)
VLSQFEEELRRAVARRMPGRGRAVILLSGGKDSSCLAIAASRVASERFATLGIGFADQATDETLYAGEVSRVLGLEHRMVRFAAGDYAAALPEAARLADQPFGDPTYLPVLLALRSLKGEDRVVFDGSGNDLYFDFAASREEQIVSRLQHWLPEGVRRNLPVTWLRGTRYFDAGWKLSQPASELLVRPTWRGWTFDEVARLTGHRMDIRDTAFFGVWTRYGRLGTSVVKLAIDCFLQEPEGEFRRTAQSGLIAGKLARFPYTDDDLTAFIGGLSPRLKMDRGVYKPLLLALMKKYLPGNLVDRKKGYFLNDLSLVLKHNRYELLREHLSPEALRAAGRFDPTVVGERVAEYTAGDEGSRVVKSLYALLLLQIWLAGLASSS